MNKLIKYGILFNVVAVLIFGLIYFGMKDDNGKIGASIIDFGILSGLSIAFIVRGRWYCIHDRYICKECDHHQEDRNVICLKCDKNYYKEYDISGKMNHPKFCKDCGTKLVLDERDKP